MKDKFRVIHRPEPIPHSLFIAHKRIPEDIREKLIKSIINWPNTESGKKILANKKIVPMLRTEDSVYDVIRN